MAGGRGGVGGAGGDPGGEGGVGGEGGKPGGKGGDDGDGGLYGSSGEGDSDSGGVAICSGFCCASAGPMPSSIATARAPSITHRAHQGTVRRGTRVVAVAFKVYAATQKRSLHSVAASRGGILGPRRVR